MTCGPEGIGQDEDRLPDWQPAGDYTIKLLVNLLARNRSKCLDRLLKGARPRALGDEARRSRARAGIQLQLSLEDKLGVDDIMGW